MHKTEARFQRPSEFHEPVVPVALRPEQAARAVGVARDFFDREIAPQLRVIRLGSRVRLYAVSELRDWADRMSQDPVDDGVGGA